MENKKYSQEDLLAVVRNDKWRQRKKYTVPETVKPPLTRKQKDTLLFQIPRNAVALFSTDELMAGAQIQGFLSHVVSSNTNMPFMGTEFGPGLLHQRQL
jgi:hypothetical protein